MFTCSDGELSCDQSGGANNLLTVDTSIGGAFVQLRHPHPVDLRQGQRTATQLLQHREPDRRIRSPSSLLASDTGFLSPVTFINNSGSLTFNSNVGDSPDSTLNWFWADAANIQGANPTNTPGTLLETVMGHASNGDLNDSFSHNGEGFFAAISCRRSR